MADILPFKRPKLSEKHKGRGLCREGFHKWEVQSEQSFDVKRGRLVTRYRCKRCGATKIKAL
ncbi:hypothetical protein DJ030_02490 [bacterium endosymbiont of Escarpia laminata]|nr:MAG: hypothetical protein DJ030_02490 [bacterium endosymbiont of Escarpia laminata]